MRYKHAVELIDVFPTILDLLELPLTNKNGSPCPIPSNRPPAPATSTQDLWKNSRHLDGKDRRLDSDMVSTECILDGQSLARVVLPSAKTIQWNNNWESQPQFPELVLRGNVLSADQKTAERSVKSSGGWSTSLDTFWTVMTGWASSFPKKPADLKYVPISLPKKYALSQKWICAPEGTVVNTLGIGSQGVAIGRSYRARRADVVWENCRIHGRPSGQQRVSLMGYSLRTENFRYTMYIPYDENNCTVSLDWLKIKSQELYIHNTTSSQYVDETVNILQPMKASPSAVVRAIRTEIFKILANPALFKYRCVVQSD
jgi:hypothetical protein